MQLTTLLAAVERGDDLTVSEFLDGHALAPAAALTDDDATTLFWAVLRAGRDELVSALVGRVDLDRPGPAGLDPVTWAAAHGRAAELQAMLPGEPQVSAPGGGPHRRALRAAQDALDAGALPPPAHRAVVTDVEAALGIHRPAGELLARALVSGDPGHADWFSSSFRLGLRFDRETFVWARDLARDGESRLHRLFGTDTLGSLGLPPQISVEDIEAPFADEAADFLRPLLDTESDPYALRSVMRAFGLHCRPGETRAFLRHARHPDAGVRRYVGGALPHGPEVLDALVRLAGDPVPDVRVPALQRLVWLRADTPRVRAALADQLGHPDVAGRIAAASGLALRGDARGRALLEELRSDPVHRRILGPGGLGELHHVLRSAPGGVRGGVPGT
ncbi:hypothetical protein [Streptomyces sp. NPDC048659]|uniref:hypothetical protein n=1 Tax=Streptomyces sp. NPDC048659 TaxID=3155489 RepID=UPI00344864FE